MARPPRRKAAATNLATWLRRSFAPPGSSEPQIRRFPTAVPDDSRRVSFPELVRAKFLSPGEEILCRTLKHQQRGGADRFIGGARVATDGTVEYKGERYSVPSKLAVRMVNDSGGKTEALNGYDYIFVRTTAGIVSLSELRERFLGQAS